MGQGSHDEMQDIINQTVTALNTLSQRIAAPTAESLLHPVDAELRLRRRRERAFSVNYFGDAAWDIVLELERAQRMGHNLAITDIGVESRIPLTTVLRYLTRLEKDGFIHRKVDPTDRRRVFVTLTQLGYDLVCQSFGLEPRQIENSASATIGYAAPAPASCFARS
ncbi:MarR family transcriptional regulator [Chakrabartia godavariana]|nr:MarR family transcriptional regulator [Chakrabartia godavariana]